MHQLKTSPLSFFLNTLPHRANNSDAGLIGGAGCTVTQVDRSCSLTAVGTANVAALRPTTISTLVRCVASIEYCNLAEIFSAFHPLTTAHIHSHSVRYAYDRASFRNVRVYVIGSAFLGHLHPHEHLQMLPCATEPCLEYLHCTL